MQHNGDLRWDVVCFLVWNDVAYHWDQTLYLMNLFVSLALPYICSLYLDACEDTFQHRLDWLVPAFLLMTILSVSLFFVLLFIHSMISKEVHWFLFTNLNYFIRGSNSTRTGFTIFEGCIFQISLTGFRMLLSLLLGANLLSLVFAHGSLVNPLPRSSAKTDKNKGRDKYKTRTKTFKVCLLIDHLKTLCYGSERVWLQS